MSSLLAPAQQKGRTVSQILPTVKCSNCNHPVPIAQLGDHVCAPASPLTLDKPPNSPRATAALLPAKYQTLVPAPRQHAPPPSKHAASRSTGPLNVRKTHSSTSSSGSLSASAARSQHVPSPSPLSQIASASLALVAFPTPPDSSTVASPLASRPVPAHNDSPFFIGEDPFARAPSSASMRPSDRPPPVHDPRARAPSSVSLRPSLDRPAGTADPRARTVSSASSRPSYDRPSSTDPRSRTPSSASSPPAIDQPADHRARTPSNAGMPDPRARPPSPASMRPANTPTLPHQARPAAQSNPAPFDQQFAPRGTAPGSLPPPVLRPRATTNVSADQGSQIIYQTAGSNAQPARARTPSNASPVSPYGASSLRSPPPPTPGYQGRRSSEDVDTKTGGEAGMAGVGRRGFAAVARTALVAANMMNSRPGDPNEGADWPQAQGMDGRRANAPRFLDIGSATKYASVNTPPLSPTSGYTSSPHSPFSQNSPLSSDNSTPHANVNTVSPVSPARSGGGRIIPAALDPPKTPLPATPSTPSMGIKLPFFEKFKNKLPNTDITADEDHAEVVSADIGPSPLSPTLSTSSYGGLAYADSDEEDTAGTAVSPTTSASTAVASGQGKVRFPSMDSKRKSVRVESKYSSSSSSSSGTPRLPMRSLSASTATSTYSARTASKSTGALDRAMDTLFEEDPGSPTTASATSPPPLTIPLIPDGQRDSKPPKLPMRSHTSPTLSAGRAEGKRQPKIRQCVKCDKVIDDGRWIQMDGGSVLCDRCWKNMYLPKCRRCNLPIEKQAVSSSDGQLKGKYHRECFNCHICHTPFPDRSFYVLDGQPLCAYHYHKANGSLCAAATCGEPIEGPCAVSHAGARYHPEHLLCEHARCAERLVEYWEVDGRMLCERHAQATMRAAQEEEAAGHSAARAMKRTTRFIDIAGLGGSGLL